jgi:hypothetical protein
VVRVPDQEGYIEEIQMAGQPTALSLAEAAATLRAAMRDRSYRATPVGGLVGRYVRWLRNEWGATPATVRDYEAVLARMSLTLARAADGNRGRPSGRDRPVGRPRGSDARQGYVNHPLVLGVGGGA